MKNRYEDRVAIVTGAGSGIGRAITNGLLGEGALVVANDLSAASLDAIEGVTRVPGDVADPATSERLVQTALKLRDGRIDALFNNAGISLSSPATEMTLAEWRRVMGCNLDGAFLVATNVGRLMVAQGRGAILNTASTAGIFGIPNRLSYVASKHGVVGLTRGLAVEWSRHGVRVNALCPGFTETGMNEEARASHPEAWRAREAKAPMRRGGLPSEQAATALFLNSDEASYTTGQVCVVDGGQHTLYSGYS